MTYLLDNPSGGGGPSGGAPLPGSVTYPSLDPGLIVSLSPWRNRIINGDCRIQQLPPCNAVANTFQYGGVDRFANVCGGASPTPGVQQLVQGDPDENGVNKFWVKQIVTTAVTDFSTSKYWGGINQFILGVNSYDLKGQPIAVGFRFKAKPAGVYSVTLFDHPALSMSCTQNITVPVADTPAWYTVLFPPMPNAIGIAANVITWLSLRIAGINKGTAACPAAQLGAWQSAPAYYCSDTTTNWGAAVNNYIQATDIQLEAGTVSTPFERTPYEHQFNLCRAYCNTSYPKQPGNASMVGAANQDFTAIPVWTGPTADANSYLGVPVSFGMSGMIKSPTVTIYNPHVAASVGTGWAQNAAVALVATVGNTSPFMAFISLANASLQARDIIKFHYVAMAEI